MKAVQDKKILSKKEFYARFAELEPKLKKSFERAWEMAIDFRRFREEAGF